MSTVSTEKTTAAFVTIQPSQQDWDATEGERAVKQAMAKISAKLLRKRAGAGLIVASQFGGLVQMGRYIRAMSNPDHRHVSEQYAMAYLRGALRGLDYAVHDNGQPMERATDA